MQFYRANLYIFLRRMRLHLISLTVLWLCSREKVYGKPDPKFYLIETKGNLLFSLHQFFTAEARFEPLPPAVWFSFSGPKYDCKLFWVNLYQKFEIEKYTVCSKLIFPKKIEKHFF